MVDGLLVVYVVIVAIGMDLEILCSTNTSFVIARRVVGVAYGRIRLGFVVETEIAVGLEIVVPEGFAGTCGAAFEAVAISSD